MVGAAAATWADRTAGSRAELLAGVFTLAVSAAGRHLKGLIDGKTVAHGKVAPAAEGSCGLLVDGRGIVRVHSLRVCGSA
jgi:hypothetical protein